MQLSIDLALTVAVLAFLAGFFWTFGVWVADRLLASRKAA